MQSEYQQDILQLYPQNVQICLQVGLKVRPCQEFQNKFPNLYSEPMQYNNPNGKWSECIPYMIINLEHERDIYLGKDTVMAYAREEDKSCDYLELNEITKLPDLKKDYLTKR